MLSMSPDALPSDFVKMGWCQGRLAENENGEVQFLDSPEAARVCLIGAISRYIDLQKGKVSEEQLLDICEEMVGTSGLAMWNDAPGRTQQEVVNLLAEVERKLGLRR